MREKLLDDLVVRRCLHIIILFLRLLEDVAILKGTGMHANDTTLPTQRQRTHLPVVLQNLPDLPRQEPSPHRESSTPTLIR